MPASVPVVRTRRAGITRVPDPLTEPPALCAFAGQATVGKRKAPYDEAEHNADGRNVQNRPKAHRDSPGRQPDGTIPISPERCQRASRRLGEYRRTDVRDATGLPNPSCMLGP